MNQKEQSQTPHLKNNNFDDFNNNIGQAPTPDSPGLMTGIVPERRRKRLRTGQRFMTGVSGSTPGFSKFGSGSKQEAIPEEKKMGSMQNFGGISSGGNGNSRKVFNMGKKNYVPSIQNFGDIEEEEELEAEEV